MKKIIAVTGYYGTGSSAIWDLLSEYKGVSTGLPNEEMAYEHVALYTPNGLFDLEEKLLRNNDLHRSDEAIHSFYQEMKLLAENNFGWFGSYKKLTGADFMQLVDKFIEDLGCIELNDRYYGQYKGTRFSIIKCILQIAAKVVFHRKIYAWGRQYTYKDKRIHINVCFPTEEEFYTAAKKFLDGYIMLFSKNDTDTVLFDHLLLPHNAYKVPRFFDDRFRMIIVDRDIRDLYVLNKYIWKKLNTGYFFPLEVDEFIDFWRKMRGCEKKIEDPRILRIYFEELIYNYESTIDKIEQFIGLDADSHIFKKKFFQPERSIKNTQVYRTNDEWSGEIRKIHEQLTDFEYDFPFIAETKLSEMFDDSRA